MFNIAVAQSGGPTAAINSSLAGVFTEAARCPEIGTVFGSVNGIEGILRDDLVDLGKILISEHDVQLLMKTPSTVLGSCRYKLKEPDEDDSDYRKAADTLRKHGVGALFYIGGNDSMDAVMKLDRWFRSNNIDIKVVGIPKTIDNDVAVTDHTPGFGSAAKYVAATLQEIIRDSRVYSIPSITIVEVMGREAGWLAASSCVLRANGEPAPHLIYLPEADFSEEKFLTDLAETRKRYMAVIVAVSEGIQLRRRETAADAFGHTQLAGVGKHLENIAREKFGCKVRSIELNVMQRCGSHIASMTDIAEASEIGAAAVRAALNGETGVMMVFKRISGSPYRTEILTTAVENTANKEKLFPKEWITVQGNDVTADALEYFLPLIQGEPEIEYRNGIPVHFVLRGDGGSGIF